VGGADAGVHARCNAVKQEGTMPRICNATLGVALLAGAALAAPAMADSFVFSTGNPDGRIATASRPGPASGANQETESADDFVLAQQTTITSASFTGLIPLGVPLSAVSQVRVEIYRVFPSDSDVNRTSGAPLFSTAQVPTRVNSPSDVEFTDRDSSVAGELSFTPAVVNGTFTAANSVDTGIHPLPSVFTGGEGPVTGQEVQFVVTFDTPLDLPADHYFFVPQVLLSDPNDHFLWLSAPRPIVPPGTPFLPDLQSWIRNDSLAPDWLRIGQDIVAPTDTTARFNAVFSLAGETEDVGEPATMTLLGAGVGFLAVLRRRRRPRSAMR
jgi:hypothetical protein